MQTLRRALVLVSLLPSLAAGPSQSGDPSGEWEALLARDARIAFSSRSEENAQAVLAQNESPLERATALFSLGACGAQDERPRLTSWASEGASEERQAAILGLGELAAAGGPSASISILLMEWLDDDDLAIAECAALACLRGGTQNARERVRTVATDTGHRLRERAEALLFFQGNPEGNAVPRAIQKLFDLRWEAARRFGTIDGRSWAVTQRMELTEDREFMRSIILLTAAELSFAGIRDHLLEALVEVGDAPAIRAAVRAMPRQVDELVSAELWEPATPELWGVMVNEAVEQGVASLMPRAFEQAVRLPETAATAAGVLARSDDRYAQVLPAALRDQTNAVNRILGALAVADGSADNFLSDLIDLERDPDPYVRAAALAARIQMGDPRAPAIAMGILDPESESTQEERDILVERIAKSHRLRRLIEFMQDAIELTEGRNWALFAAALKLHQQPVDTGVLASHFGELEPGSFERRIVIRALSRFPSDEDRRFLAGLFPLENDREGNLELAVGLLRSGHPEGLPLLQAAVWGGDWNESVLAAAIVKDTSGVRLLEHWVAKPPPYASATDIRRLGFAIGEWGGMDAFQSLTRNVGGGAERPALQGALLGALVSRTH